MAMPCVVMMWASAGGWESAAARADGELNGEAAEFDGTLMVAIHLILICPPILLGLSTACYTVYVWKTRGQSDNAPVDVEREISLSAKIRRIYKKAEDLIEAKHLGGENDKTDVDKDEAKSSRTKSHEKKRGSSSGSSWSSWTSSKNSTKDEDDADVDAEAEELLRRLSDPTRLLGSYKRKSDGARTAVSTDASDIVAAEPEGSPDDHQTRSRYAESERKKKKKKKKKKKSKSKRRERSDSMDSEASTGSPPDGGDPDGGTRRGAASRLRGIEGLRGDQQRRLSNFTAGRGAGAGTASMLAAMREQEEDAYHGLEGEREHERAREEAALAARKSRQSSRHHRHPQQAAPPPPSSATRRRSSATRRGSSSAQRRSSNARRASGQGDMRRSSTRRNSAELLVPLTRPPPSHMNGKEPSLAPRKRKGKKTKGKFGRRRALTTTGSLIPVSRKKKHRRKKDKGKDPTKKKKKKTSKKKDKGAKRKKKNTNKKKKKASNVTLAAAGSDVTLT